MSGSGQSLARWVVCGSVLALGACAVAPPSGPTVMAVPGQGKSFTQFQQDDAGCRQYAAARTGGTTPSEAATNAGIGSALVGAALGAAAGAAIGSVGAAVGAGAAIGGAAGLLAGSAIGSANAAGSAAAVQRSYDISYGQCMAAHGDKLAAGPRAYPTYGYAYPAYGYPYYAYGYPYPYAGPVVIAPSISFGWGWGHYGHWGWRR